MLLIPIAQEDSTVRRTPWVSFSLIGLNFVVFLAIAFLGGDAELRASKGIESFLTYLSQHPYLSVPPEMASRFGPEFEAELENARAHFRALQGTADSALAAEQQQKLNELAAEAQTALRSRVAHRLGFVPGEPRLHGVLTSMFVHGGWLHLVGNMLFLFLSGPFVEDHYGRPLFAGLYLLSGVVALVAHGAGEPDSLVPLIGASGAIAGVMGAFLVRLGTARIRFLLLPVPFLPVLRTTIVLPAFVVLPIWALEQLWYAQTAPEASGVAFWAHVGGFAFGLVAAVAIKLAKVEENWIHPAIERETTLAQDPRLEEAMEARLRGDLAAARSALSGLLAADPENLDAWRESFETALDAADPAETGRSGERLLTLLTKAGEDELAAELTHDPRWRSLPDLPVRFHLAVAAHLEREGDGREALEQYALVVRRSPRDVAALRALLRRAEILRAADDLRAAGRALEEAKAHPACTDAWPATIDRALAELDRPRRR